MSAIGMTVKCLKERGIRYTLSKIGLRLGLIKDDNELLYLSKYTGRKYASMTDEQRRAALCGWYQDNMGKTLNLDDPKTFTEKIQWLKLFDRDPLKSELADKYLAPKYAKEKCGDLLEVVENYGAYDSASEIEWDKLPDQFVLKCNHGCGMNIIVKDKSSLDIRKSGKQLDRWLSIDFGNALGGFEMHYSGIKRKIIAEKYIKEMDGNLHDYKIHCFNGTPRFIQLIGDRTAHSGKMAFFDCEWNRLEETTGDYPLYDISPEKPASLDRMLQCARILSSPFSYVRVDLYEIGGVPYFGELTFTPAGGSYRHMAPEGTDEKWGSWLSLPAKSDK